MNSDSLLYDFFFNSEAEKHLKVGSMREEVAFLFLPQGF